MSMYGIDVSSWQGDFNFASYKDKFVIIRAGYGTASEDSQFMNNVAKCEKLGIPYGVYWFSEAVNTEQSKAEAKAFLNMIKKCKNIRMGVWLDMEDSTYKNKFRWKTKANISAICREWCKIVEGAGYYTGIYCSKSWLNYLESDLSKYDKWIASWGTNNGRVNDNTSSLGSILQYTSKLDGKSLDGNYCYVDIKRFVKNGKQEKPKATTQPKTTTHDELINELALRVKKGEFGNGTTRKIALGKLYDEVQKKVNGE